MFEGFVGHHWAEIGAADADIDDILDPLPRMALPGSAPDAFRKFPHLIEYRMDLGDDVLTINGDFRAPRRAQSHMKNRPIFGEIDFFALKHRIDPAFQTRLFGELKKQGEGLIGDPIL